MTQDSSKRVAVEIDMITNLPIELTLHILALLPIKDAAKMSVLGQRWRYIWRTNPNIVLDRHSLEILLRKSLSHGSVLLFVMAVDEILLLHEGDIQKFEFYCPTIDNSIHYNIHIWIQCVTRKGVTELTIDNMPNSVLYPPWSHVFNCSTLKHLRLCKCSLRPPNYFTNFEKLETLYMERCCFEYIKNVMKTPRLIRLTMIYCYDRNRNQRLNLDSPLLEYLDLQFCRNHFPNIFCFTEYKKVRVLKLEHYEYRNLSYIPSNEDRSTLVKLVSSLAPTLEILTLGPLLVQMLSGNTVPFPLNRLLRLILRVDFDDEASISMALHLIKSSPCLKSLHISVVASVRHVSNGEAVKYLSESVLLDEQLNKLKESACLEQQFSNLKDVIISGFNGSKVEALFVKLLLRESPSLTRMQIEHAKNWEERDTTSIDRELKCSTKASSKTKILCLAHT